jgi:hypothetical protein
LPTTAVLAAGFPFWIEGGAPFCTPIYFGDVPGLVEGIVQINCQVMGDFPGSGWHTFGDTDNSMYAVYVQ